MKKTTHKKLQNVYILIATQRLLWLVQFVRCYKFKIYIHAFYFEF